MKTLNEFLEERINVNERLFNKNELYLIEKNKPIIKKIYVLGLMDGKDLEK